MTRSEIWLINLDPTIGDEIRKTRPVVIVSNPAEEMDNILDALILVLKIYA